MRPRSLSASLAGPASSVGCVLGSSLPCRVRPFAGMSFFLRASRLIANLPKDVLRNGQGVFQAPGREVTCPDKPPNAGLDAD